MHHYYNYIHSTIINHLPSYSIIYKTVIIYSIQYLNLISKIKIPQYPYSIHNLFMFFSSIDILHLVMTHFYIYSYSLCAFSRTYLSLNSTILCYLEIIPIFSSLGYFQILLHHYHHSHMPILHLLYSMLLLLLNFLTHISDSDV